MTFEYGEDDYTYSVEKDWQEIDEALANILFDEFFSKDCKDKETKKIRIEQIKNMLSSWDITDSIMNDELKEMLRQWFYDHDEAGRD